MRAGVVLVGNDYPSLRLSRGKPGQSRLLHELKRLVVGRPRLGPQGHGQLPQAPAFRHAPRLVSLDGGPAQLAVLGSESHGCLPEEVSDLAQAGQAQQCRVVNVAADLQPMIGTGEAGPRAAGLAELAAVDDVRQVVGDPGQPHGAAIARSLRAGACHQRHLPSVGRLQVQIAARGPFQYPC
jgi:hypothetical protein